MTDYSKHLRSKRTPQSRPLDGDQRRNYAGGFVWEIDLWQRLDRFLILGSEGGSYYAGEPELTIDSAQAALELLASEGPAVVARLREISVAGRAHKQDPTLFVLALAFAKGDVATKRAAADAFPEIVRTASQLFAFLSYANDLRGWGRTLRRAVAAWYDGRDLRELAYQTSKYAVRRGWSHRDALRLAHPRANDAERDALYGWLVGKRTKFDALASNAEWSGYLRAVEAVRTTDRAAAAAELVRSWNLPREVVPTELLRESTVWEALLERMPMTALIRNLATMTRVGLVTPMSEAADRIAERLTDASQLRRARIHPLQLLAALTTYRRGRGVRSRGQGWKPVAEVLDALDSAFYQAFEHAPTSGKRVLLALDVSGSMGWGSVSGIEGLTPRVASAAMALVTAATEPRHAFMAFSDVPRALAISPRQRLDDVVATVSGLPFGRTDCALPMRWAFEQGLEVDAFVVLTDNETWFGKVHPAEALRDYRAATGIDAKLAVVAMTATRFSIADPNDLGMLDLVGFATDTPRVLAEFLRG
jgi:60 kDa SS-A/Ro ribonucleoprotein